MISQEKQRETMKNKKKQRKMKISQEKQRTIKKHKEKTRKMQISQEKQRTIKNTQEKHRKIRIPQEKQRNQVFRVTNLCGKITLSQACRRLSIHLQRFLEDQEEHTYTQVAKQCTPRGPPDALFYNVWGPPGGTLLSYQGVQ